MGVIEALVVIEVAVMELIVIPVVKDIMEITIIIMVTIMGTMVITVGVVVGMVQDGMVGYSLALSLYI